MKNYLYLTLFILFLSCQSGNSISNKTASHDPLATQLQQVYDNGNLPGFSVTITDEDEAIYQKAFGYADVESNKAYTVNTTQPVASISKTLVGLSLLKAQELGKLNLDDPINNYLPYPLNNPKHPGVILLSGIWLTTLLALLTRTFTMHVAMYLKTMTT
jgi:CubicO group peptidase (beta-lactamase class C family)